MRGERGDEGGVRGGRGGMREGRRDEGWEEGERGEEEGKRLFKCSVESCSNFIGYSLHHSRVYNDHKRF